MASDGSAGSRSREEQALPPGALARHSDGVDRRRVLARALHEPAPPRSRRITERLEELREQIAKYRAKAIALHAKLVELEPSNGEEVAALRRKLIDSSVKLEDVVRSLIESRGPR
jgi:hypothetical protein